SAATVQQRCSNHSRPWNRPTRRLGLALPPGRSGSLNGKDAAAVRVDGLEHEPFSPCQSRQLDESLDFFVRGLRYSNPQRTIKFDGESVARCINQLNNRIKLVLTEPCQSHRCPGSENFSNKHSGTQILVVFRH